MKKIFNKIALFAVVCLIGFGSLLGNKAFAFTPSDVTWSQSKIYTTSDFNSLGFEKISNIDSNYKKIAVFSNFSFYIDTRDLSIIIPVSSDFYETNKTYLDLVNMDFCCYRINEEINQLWDFNSLTISNSFQSYNLDFIHSNTFYHITSSPFEYLWFVSSLDVPFNSNSYGTSSYSYNQISNSFSKGGTFNFSKVYNTDFYLSYRLYLNGDEYSTYLFDMLDNPPVQAPTIELNVLPTNEKFNFYINDVKQDLVSSGSLLKYKDKQGLYKDFEVGVDYDVRLVPIGDYQTQQATIQLKDGLNSFDVTLVPNVYIDYEVKSFPDTAFVTLTSGGTKVDGIGSAIIHVVDGSTVTIDVDTTSGKYKPYNASVKVTSSSINPYTIELERIYNTLNIKTNDPLEYDLYIDNILQGTYSGNKSLISYKDKVGSVYEFDSEVPYNIKLVPKDNLYKPFISKDVFVGTSTDIDVSFVKYKFYDYTINVVQDGALISVEYDGYTSSKKNSLTINNIKEDTNVNIKVSLKGYNDYFDTIIINDSSSNPYVIDLVNTLYNFTINAVPSGSLINIYNGSELLVSSKDVATVRVPAGTVLRWVVTKDGYITQESTYTVDYNDYSYNVKLVESVTPVPPVPVDKDTVTLVGDGIKIPIPKDFYTYMSRSFSRYNSLNLNDTGLFVLKQSGLPIYRVYFCDSIFEFRTGKENGKGSDVVFLYDFSKPFGEDNFVHGCYFDFNIDTNEVENFTILDKRSPNPNIGELNTIRLDMTSLVYYNMKFQYTIYNFNSNFHLDLDPYLQYYLEYASPLPPIEIDGWAGNNNFNALNMVLTAFFGVFKVLNIPILGNITLGSLAVIPIIFGLFAWLIALGSGHGRR